MALRKPLFISSEGYSEEMAATDTAAFGGLSLSGALAMGTNRITGLGDAVNPQDAVTKAQLDVAIVTGGTVKELLFDQQQLSNTQGVLAAEVLFFSAQPTAGDTVVFSNGTLTRTYTFVANTGLEVAATDVSIESSATTAMQRLALRVMADATNTVWDLTFRETEHTNLNAAGVLVASERVSATGASPSRLYGVWDTQAGVSVIEFASGATPTVAADYSSVSATQLSFTDPGAGRFGLRRAQASLVAGEIHFIRTNDSQYAWDETTSSWNVLSGTSSIPDATSASGGGTKGKVTADSDKGLAIVSGVMEVKLNGTTLVLGASGLSVQGLPSLFQVNGTPVSNNVTAANLNTLTGGGSTSLHSHANDHARLHSMTSSADHSVSGLTPGDVLTALTASTFGWSTPGASAYTPRVEGTYTTAVDTTANGDAVYWNGSDTIGKARADTDTKARVTGVVRTGGGAAPTSVAIVSAGPCAGVLSGATANTPYYLQDTGGIGTTVPSAGSRIIRVGLAMNATDLWVEILDYGKRAA